MRAYRNVRTDIADGLPSSRHLRPTHCPHEVPAAPDNEAESLSPFAKGSRVRVLHLTNATHLNGKAGVISRFDPATGCVHVQLEGTESEIRLLSKFVQPASSGHEESAHLSESTPRCPVDAVEESSEQMHVDALKAAVLVLKVTSSILRGAPYTSSWAINGCDINNAETSSPGVGMTRRWRKSRVFEELQSRQTWCKPELDLRIDAFEFEGQQVQPHQNSQSIHTSYQ